MSTRYACPPERTLPSTREEASLLGAHLFSTSSPCRRGHSSPRRTSDGKCVECLRENDAKRYQRHSSKRKHAAKSAYWASPETKKAAVRKYRELNAEALKAKRKQDYAENSEEIKASVKARRHANPDVNKAACRRYYSANSAKCREQNKRWSRENPDEYRAIRGSIRAKRKRAVGKFSPDDLRRIRAQQGDKCACCKSALNGKGEIDHIAPLSKGGTNFPNNLQLLCKPCNCAKGARDPIEFMQSKGYLI